MAYEQNPSCDILWLPPCPMCSHVRYWQEASTDELDAPIFRLARHTTETRGANHWYVCGCSHVNAVMVNGPPIRNRLRLAVRWRREWHRLLETHLAGFPVGTAEKIRDRLGHHFFGEEKEAPPPPPPSSDSDLGRPPWKALLKQCFAALPPEAPTPKQKEEDDDRSLPYWQR